MRTFILFSAFCAVAFARVPTTFENHPAATLPFMPAPSVSAHGVPPMLFESPAATLPFIQDEYVNAMPQVAPQMPPQAPPAPPMPMISIEININGQNINNPGQPGNPGESEEELTPYPGQLTKPHLNAGMMSKPAREGEEEEEETFTPYSVNIHDLKRPAPLFPGMLAKPAPLEGGEEEEETFTPYSVNIHDLKKPAREPTIFEDMNMPEHIPHANNALPPPPAAVPMIHISLNL